VLFFLSLATRRVEFIACTPNPDGAWVTQQARNLVMQLGDRESRVRLLIHDRDAKFSPSLDEVVRSERIEVIRTPVQAPNANANAERWVRTVRSDCLDRILILGRRHLERVLRVYTTGTGHTVRSDSPLQTAACPPTTTSHALRLPSAVTTLSAG
jgi:putative transposase